MDQHEINPNKFKHQIVDSKIQMECSYFKNIQQQIYQPIWISCGTNLKVSFFVATYIFTLRYIFALYKILQSSHHIFITLLIKQSVMAYYYYPQGHPIKSLQPSPSLPSMRSPIGLNQKTSNDISKIIQSIAGKGGLYIGNISCAQSPALLKMYKIGAVVTIDNTDTIRFDNNTIQQHFIMPISESTSNDEVFKYINQTVDFISDSLKKTNVMVHCHSGLRLSSAVAIAYLIKNNQLTTQKAFSHIKKCRSVAKIDNQLFQRLKNYQTSCRFPKQEYRLPKINQLVESTFTSDSDQPPQFNLPLEAQFNKTSPTPKPNGIQLTQSYQGFF